MTTAPATDATPDFENLVRFLRDRYGDELRWVASFDARSYDYRVQYLRPDPKTELSDHEFDVVVHRSIAPFRRPYVEEEYTHLGPARTPVIDHERATAVHRYPGDATGVIVGFAAGDDLSLPAFVDDCSTALYPEGVTA